MNFSTDRDLVVVEPGVFEEVVIAAQQRVRVKDGELAGTTLSSVEADFAAAGVEAGSVVLVDRVAYEVIERVDAGTLTVSLPRARVDGEAVMGMQGEGLEVIVRTFAQQAGLVRDALLRLLGIDTDVEGSQVGGLSEESVMSLGVMARLEALGTLERVYSAGQAVMGENGGLAVKAERYRRLFREACRGARVWVDVNGDGLAEERRDLGLVRLRRA